MSHWRPGLWIGTLPYYVHDQAELQRLIDIFCRRMYVDQSAYNIEILDKRVFAVRRPVENVIDSL